MEYCKSATDKSIAAIMAAVLAFKRSAWALDRWVWLESADVKLRFHDRKT